MMDRTITLIRHGKTSGNREKRYVGITDEALSSEGELEIKTRAYPKADIVFSSPMMRCLQTAKIIYPAMEPVVIPDLRETDFGRFEGVDRSDREYQAAKREYFVRYPGGESFFDLVARVYPLLEELGDTNALLVTHGGICRIIRSYFEDLGNEEFVQFSQGNCEVRMYP